MSLALLTAGVRPVSATGQMIAECQIRIRHSLGTMAPRTHSIAADEKRDKNRYITRMDYAHTVGWWVRIYQASKVVAQKFFSDKANRGSDKALSAARKWRDKQLKALGIVTPRRRIHTSDSRSLSRVVGVSPEINRRYRSPYVSGWKATWPGPSGQEYRRFTVADYGYEAAFRAAVAERYARIGGIPPDLDAPSERSVLARARIRRSQG